MTIKDIDCPRFVTVEHTRRKKGCRVMEVSLRKIRDSIQKSIYFNYWRLTVTQFEQQRNTNLLPVYWYRGGITIGYFEDSVQWTVLNISLSDKGPLLETLELFAISHGSEQPLNFLLLFYLSYFRNSFIIWKCIHLTTILLYFLIYI